MGGSGGATRKVKEEEERRVVEGKGGVLEGNEEKSRGAER